MRILVVEDEPKTAAFLSQGLREAGYTVEVAHDGDKALKLAGSGRFDLLVVDVMLPNKSGFDVVSELRRHDADVPVLFLTARDSVGDRVKGLQLGGDDYLVKPFAFAELLARIQRLLRRRAPVESSEHIRVQDLELDTVRHKATRGGAPLNLTPKEFLLLARLAQTPGDVVTRQQIVEHLWDIDFETNTNVVEVVVRRLRAKVDDPFPKKLVHTIRGLGYVLKPD
jgi:two-component system copper resistance phosphate regulon response regulator CusR